MSPATHDRIRQAVRGRGFVGRKPPEFCYWLFEVLGLQRGDELVDLFPGSGAVQRAWQEWQDGWMAA